MLNSKNSSEKITAAVYVIMSLFVILVIRLWQLQILQGDEYRKLSEENRLRIIKIAAPRGIVYDRNNTPLVKNSPYYSVSLSQQDVGRIDIRTLSEMLKTDMDSLSEKIYRQKRSIYESIKLKDGLSFNEIAFIEARKSDFPGLNIDVDVSREYLFGDIGAHFIGYLGKLREFQSKDPEFRDVPSDAFIGQWGI